MSAADAFFYWGVIPLKEEIDQDIRTGLLQPQRSMFYRRDYGAGVADFENSPVSLVTLVKLRLEVMKFFSVRNRAVTTGQTIKGIQYPDRRAATSQTVVTVEDQGGGNLSVNVPYVILSDLTTGRNARIPLGG